MFRLSVLLLDSMSKLIHNRCTSELIIKLYGYLRICKRAIACLFLCFNPLFSVVQFWNYTKTIIRLRLSEYCRIIPETKSRGLFVFLWQWPTRKLKLLWSLRSFSFHYFCNLFCLCIYFPCNVPLCSNNYL